MKLKKYGDRLDHLNASRNVHREFEDEPIRRPGPMPTFGGLTQIPRGDCDCCTGCVCYPETPITACATVPCLVSEYKVVGTFPFASSGVMSHDTGCNYSGDSFNVTICGVDYGSFHWELVVALDPWASTLTLVSDGTGSIPLAYKNAHPFHPICSNEYRIVFNCSLPETVAHQFPKVICVAPVGAACADCPTANVASVCCPVDGYPARLRADITFSAIMGPNCDINGKTLYLDYVPATDVLWRGTLSTASCDLTFEYRMLGGGGSPSCNQTLDIYPTGTTPSVPGDYCAQWNEAPNCPFATVVLSTLWSNVATCPCCTAGTITVTVSGA